jgi:hypothetical protein
MAPDRGVTERLLVAQSCLPKDMIGLPLASENYLNPTLVQKEEALFQEIISIDKAVMHEGKP